MQFNEQAFIHITMSMDENELTRLQSIVHLEMNRRARGWDERGVWGSYNCTVCQQPFPYLYNQIQIHPGLLCEACVTREINNAVPELNWSPQPVTDLLGRENLGQWRRLLHLNAWLPGIADMSNTLEFDINPEAIPNLRKILGRKTYGEWDNNQLSFAEVYKTFESQQELEEAIAESEPLYVKVFRKKRKL